MKVQLLLAIALLAALGASVSHPVHAQAGNAGAPPLPGDSAKIVDASPAVVTSASKFQRLVQLPANGSSISYRHELELPVGVRIRASLDEAGKGAMTEDLEVVDAKGRTLGYIDAAWAQDAIGQSLPSYFRIEGNTLVQVVETSKALGDVTALLQYTGVAAESAPTGTTQEKAYVGIPSNYVYNLNHPRKTLHDYCTKSPDEFPNPVGANANFRGPCARHDMCFEQRQASQGTCNNRLWSNLISNCEYTYAWYNPTRQACINTAHVYWVAVTANTLWPW
jgi:hypothetical protein